MTYARVGVFTLTALIMLCTDGTIASVNSFDKYHNSSAVIKMAFRLMTCSTQQIYFWGGGWGERVLHTLVQL